MGTSLVVGASGHGTLLVSSGGQVTTPQLSVSSVNVTSGEGTVTITGTGSSLTVTGAADIGDNRVGSLTVSNGGTLDTRSGLNIGKSATGFGNLTVTGPGTLWTNSGPINVGPGASGTLDVSNGGHGVLLGDRTLHAATVRLVRGEPGQTPFAVARALCRRLCPAPRLPDHVVYGSNNWYYAYGRSSHEEILRDADILLSHAPGGDNPPYMVIDDGWQENRSAAGPSILTPS
jgi:T5SS/PEP-CTERM-associated repeat protein